MRNSLCVLPVGGGDPRTCTRLPPTCICSDWDFREGREALSITLIWDISLVTGSLKHCATMPPVTPLDMLILCLSRSLCIFQLLLLVSSRCRLLHCLPLLNLTHFGQHSPSSVYACSFNPFSVEHSATHCGFCLGMLLPCHGSIRPFAALPAHVAPSTHVHTHFCVDSELGRSELFS